MSEAPRTCPSCGVAALSSQVRLVVDTCGHQKCRRCLLLEDSGCAQCRQRCSVIVRLDTVDSRHYHHQGEQEEGEGEGLEQQLENIYLSDDGEEEEEDAVSIHSDLKAELLLGVRGDIVQHWVENNREHFEGALEVLDTVVEICQGH